MGSIALVNYTPAPRRGRGVYCFTSVRLSVQDIFRRIFLSNYQWQKSDIWSQASYRYAILWVAFLDPSDSYFLFADLVCFYTHWTYMHIFLSNHWWHNLIFGHKLHIGISFCGKRFWPVRCLLPVCRLSWLLYTLNICTFFVTFFEATIDGRNLIFGHELHIGTQYCGKCFWIRQIPNSCFPTELHTEFL